VIGIVHNQVLINPGQIQENIDRYRPGAIRTRFVSQRLLYGILLLIRLANSEILK